MEYPHATNPWLNSPRIHSSQHQGQLQRRRGRPHHMPQNSGRYFSSTHATASSIGSYSSDSETEFAYSDSEDGRPERFSPMGTRGRRNRLRIAGEDYPIPLPFVATLQTAGPHQYHQYGQNGQYPSTLRDTTLGIRTPRLDREEIFLFPHPRNIVRLVVTVVDGRGERRVRAIVPRSARKFDLLWALGVGERGSVVCESGGTMDPREKLGRFLERLGLGVAGSSASLLVLEESFGNPLRGRL